MVFSDTFVFFLISFRTENMEQQQATDLSNQPIPDVYFTMEDLAQHKGENDLPIWIGCNGKCVDEIVIPINSINFYWK